MGKVEGKPSLVVLRLHPDAQVPQCRVHTWVCQHVHQDSCELTKSDRRSHVMTSSRVLRIHPTVWLSRVTRNYASGATNKIHTLDPIRLRPDDYLDLAGKESQDIHLSASSSASKGTRIEFGHLVPFPSDARGFLYFKSTVLAHRRGSSPFPGQVRFRITPSADPATFSMGRDMTVSAKRRWRLKMDGVTASGFEGLAHLVERDVLLKQGFCLAYEQSDREATTILPQENIFDAASITLKTHATTKSTATFAAASVTPTDTLNSSKAAVEISWSTGRRGRDSGRSIVTLDAKRLSTLR